MAKITTFGELQALENDALAKRAASITSKAGAATLELGKILAVLDARREDKTLSAYARTVLGVEIESTCYKVAVAFGGIVGDGGHGSVIESQFDVVPVRWHVVVSSILNQMEKDKRDDSFRAEIRENVATVLRERPDKGHDTLKAILATVKPEKKEPEGGEDENAQTIVPADGISAADFIRFLGKKLEEETNTAALTNASEAFASLALWMKMKETNELTTLAKNGFSALADLADGLRVERATVAAPAEAIAA